MKWPQWQQSWFPALHIVPIIASHLYDFKAAHNTMIIESIYRLWVSFTIILKNRTALTNLPFQWLALALLLRHYFVKSAPWVQPSLPLSTYSSVPSVPGNVPALSPSPPWEFCSCPHTPFDLLSSLLLAWQSHPRENNFKQIMRYCTPHIKIGSRILL